MGNVGAAPPACQLSKAVFQPQMPIGLLRPSATQAPELSRVPIFWSALDFCPVSFLLI